MASEELKKVHRNVAEAIEVMGDICSDSHFSDTWDELHRICDLLLDAQNRIAALMTGRTASKNSK